MRCFRSLFRSAKTFRARPKTRLQVEVLESREVPSFGLDAGFGRGGLDLNPVSGQAHFDSLGGLSVLNDGKLLAVGNLQNATHPNAAGSVAVVRLNSAGAADTSFGDGHGLAILAGLTEHSVTAQVTLPNGKILVGGNRPSAATGAGTNFFVVRLNADATVDTTFGTGGEVTLNIGGADLLSGLAVQADGKIVASGITRPLDTGLNGYIAAKMAVVRFTADGVLDTSFGAHGKVVTSPGAGDWGAAGLAIQSDGKIVVGGDSRPANGSSSGNTEFMVYRFNPDGTLDKTFAGTGLAKTNYGQFYIAFATSMALLSDGTIVVGGGSDYGQGMLAWFNADGSLKSQEQLGARGTTGLIWITRLVALPKGGVEAVGTASNGADYSDFSVEYHAAPGSAADLESLSISNGWGIVQRMAAQPDGKLIVASIGFSGTGIPGEFRSAEQLAFTRFSDPGLTTSTATVIKGVVVQPAISGPVTLEATVIPVLGNADVGVVSITFREGSHVLGTVKQTTAAQTVPSPSFVVDLPDGAHTITAEFAGNGSWAASSYDYHIQFSGPSASLTLAVSNPSPTSSDSITLTATVSATVNGAPAAPDGTVSFYDGDTWLGSAGTLIGGLAVINVSGLSAGVHTLTADFSGSPSNSTPSATVFLAVRPALVAPTVQFLPVSVPPGGGPITLSASVVSDSLSGVPTGNVAFLDGTTLLGTAAIALNGVATITTNTLRPTTHLLTASYAGESYFTPAVSSVQRLTIGPVATTTSVSAPVVPGQPLVLTANVLALGAGFPIGSVTFKDGGTVLGVAPVDGRGNARLTLTTLAAGSHAITAAYSGCSTCQASTSAAVAILIAGSPSLNSTTTMLTASVPFSTAAPVFGQVEALLVQVTGQPGTTPTGLVNFYDGTTLIGSASVHSDGRRAIATAPLNLGAHHFRAVYMGDAANAGSTSAWVAIAVAQAATTLDLTGSTSTAQAGKPVAIVVHVRPQFSGSPIGSVTFMDGNTVLGTARVDGNGLAKFTTASLGLGKHSITAVYSGCSTFLRSTSDVFAVTLTPGVAAVA